MDAFVAAQQRILTNLEPDEKALLQTTTCAEDVLAEVQDIEKKHGQTSSTRKLSKKMEPFVRGMQQYGDALNVLAGTHQALGLLWGSVRVLLRLATNFIEYIDKITDMLQRLGKSLGRFKIYARLYPSSERLRTTLVEAYEKYLLFCVSSIKTFQRGKTKGTHFISNASAAIGVKQSWKPLKSQFTVLADELDDFFEEVEIEAEVAEKAAAAKARDEAEARAQHESHRSLFDWLAPVDPKTNHEAARRVHEPGTGSWICQTSHFTDWEDVPSAALWVHAKPGAGKTIIASTIITHLLQKHSSPSAVVIYFYCDYKDSQKRSTSKIFETLLAELARQDPSTLSYLERLFEKYREYRSSCSVEVLRNALLHCLQFPQRTFIVIDALDECDERENLLSELVEIINSRSKLNILLTSRPEFDIQQHLACLPNVCLTETSMSADIEVFINARLGTLLRSKKLKLRDLELRSEIERVLTSRADGMKV